MKTKWMKRTWSAIFVVVMLLSVLPMSVFAADLQKNAVGAFLLYTSDDLKAFADYVNGGNYDADAILMDNITYEGTASIGSADIARTDYDNGYTVSNIKGYSGVFDGNGYTITLPVDTYLFGAIDGATVKELTVSGGNKAIVAYMASGTVLLCNNKSTISGWAYCGSIADIVGAESSTSISDAVCVIRGCVNYGNLNVNWNVGGIVGAARGKNVLIDNCANYGNFNLGTGRYVGGIAGKLADGATVSYCFDSSTRSRVFSGDNGIAGSSNSTISNSFHVNGGVQTGATKVSGLTDEVLNILNQNTSGIKWNKDGTPSDRWNITFDANGGTGSMDVVTVASGGTYTLPESGFTAPTGHTFKAWSVGGAEKEVGDSITVTADTTVTAVWEHIYSALKYDAHGHWYECECGEKGQKNTHNFDNEMDSSCNTCGFSRTVHVHVMDYRYNDTEHWQECTDDNCPVADKAKTTPMAHDFDSDKDALCDACGFTREVKDDSFNTDLWYWMLMMLYNQEFDIMATSTEGGTITPAGVSKVKYSKDLTYTVTPDDGYAIADVLVDGKSVGAVSVYTFDNVRKDHEITAIFAEIPWENPYSDVSESDWFYEDVKFVDENNLMNGTVENEIFAPELTATRAMIVTILWRLEGAPVVDSSVSFFDVPENEWYTEAVNWASANGIVLGYDGLFNSDDAITREEFSAILHRYAAYKGMDDGIIFPMIPQYNYSEWAENNVIWADMNGLIDGIGSDMTDMTADASRAEVAAILRRFCERFIVE